MKRLIAAMTAVVLGVTLVGFSSRAADVSPFQLEAGLVYEDSSEGGIADTTVIGVGAVYSFMSVDPGSNPIAEAAFLARVPFVGLNVGFLSGDMDVGFGIPIDLDGTRIGVMAGYADSGMPLAVTFSYSSESADLSALGITGTADTSDLEFGVGAFVMPNLLVSLTYGSGDTEMTAPGFGTMEMDQRAIGFAAKWVQELGTNGSAVNVEFGYSGITVESPGDPDEEGSVIEIGADYYINQLVGIGVGIELLSGDEADDDATTFGVRASYNAGSKLGVRLAWEKTTYEDDSEDKELTISVVGRF
jgi:hypothetical protein